MVLTADTYSHVSPAFKRQAADVLRRTWGCKVNPETVASVVLGGLITLVVAGVVFWIQERRARETFEILARFLESFAEITSKGGNAKVGFSRDANGRITNASVTVTLGTIASAALVHPPTVSQTEPMPRTTGGQTDGEIS